MSFQTEVINDRDLEIPEEYLSLARRYAGWAAREGWGDRDELESAAMVGVWRAFKVKRHKGLEIENMRGWVTYFIRMRMKSHCANEIRKRKALKRQKLCVHTGRRDDAGQLAVDRGYSPPEEVDRRGFWNRACEGLTAKQDAAVNLVFREGHALRDAGRKLGIAGNNVEDSIGWALSKIVRNLRPYRETMPFPNGRSNPFKGGLQEHYIDAVTFRRCFNLLPDYLQKSQRRDGTDLRAVFSAMRYIWQTGCSLKGIQAEHPNFPRYSLIESWQKKFSEARILDQLRNILMPSERLQTVPR